MSRKGKLPVSKAKTAYGLLSEIAALAIAEPKRIRMSKWLATQTVKDYGASAPACGTVGCIAGWGAVLVGTKKERAAMLSGYFGVDGLGIAGRIFGLSKDATYSLCTTDGMCFTEGTPPHAREVIHRIRRFQKRYKAQLLAKRV